MKNALAAKYAEAMRLNPKLAVTEKELLSSTGFEEAYFEHFGLTRRDLKNLEKLGLALRGYPKNIYLPGERLPTGKVVEEGTTARGRGFRVRWTLIRKEPADGQVQSG